MATNFNEQRNRVLRTLKDAGPVVMTRLLGSAYFQAGLQALDPADRGYVFDHHLREIIEIGLLHLIETTAALAAIEVLN